MKTRLNDLRPNPFRNFKRCPLRREKVERLKQSVRETGFWENLLGRRANGRVELAYGHHRLAALRELAREGEFGGREPLVAVTVRPLDDAAMIRIMAAENMLEFRPTAEVFDETVRAAREFLLRTDAVPEGRLNAAAVAEFLGGNWREGKIRAALQRLGYYKSGVLEPEILSGLSPSAARAIQSEVARVEKEYTPPDELPDEEARRVLEHRRAVMRETAETLAAHLRAGASTAEFQEKAWDLAAGRREDRETEGADDGATGAAERRFSAIDAAAKCVNAREFKRRVELILRYRKYLAPDAADTLRATLRDLAAWTAEAARQL